MKAGFPLSSFQHERNMDILSAIAFVAEQKILESQKEGAFDNLPGMDKPLLLDDLSHLPPEVRMAYTVLKNSGFIEAPAETPAEAPREKFDEILGKVPGKALPGTEEGATFSKVRRLGVMLNRVRRAQGREQGSLFPQLDSPPLLDGAYLDKLLKRVE